MTNDSDFQMQPAEVSEASKQLDDLASRIEKLMTTERPNLTTTAAGRDEVSTGVANTLNDVSTTFGKSTDQGVEEIREIAATLRAHTDNVVAAEEGFAV